MKEYRRKDATPVAAVRLDLDTEGFTYRKWGGLQTCRRGDWLVLNQGDTYTVAHEVFERTYLEISLGVYEKVTPVWATVADREGVLATREGNSRYQPGDFLVFNSPDGSDGYPVRPAMFDRLYTAVDK